MPGPDEPAGGGVRSLDPPSRDDLVGRDDVLDQLDRALGEVARGQGRVVLLAGEAGIGKTALAARAADQARERGFRVVWAACWEGDGVPELWPWTQVARPLGEDQLLGSGRGVPPSRSDVSSEAVEEGSGSEEPSGSARFRLFDGVASLVLTEAGRVPLLIVFDDLHRADPTSLRLLDFVARRIRASRVLVLGTVRDTDLVDDEERGALVAELTRSATTVALRPLSADEVGRVMAPILGEAPGPDLAAGVQRRTGGNPFFVQEVARSLAARAPAARIDHDVPQEGIPPPIAVREVVESRLHRLGPGSLPLLEAASLAGPEFSATVLAAVAGLPIDQVETVLDRAVAAGVVVHTRAVPGPYRFAHDLYREVLAARIDGAARERLHLATGRALEEERDAGASVPPGLLADHFVHAARMGGAGDAVRFSRLAAAEATARLAHGEAARHLERAVFVLDDGLLGAEGDADRGRLLLDLGDARRRAGDLPGAREAYLAVGAWARPDANQQSEPGAVRSMPDRDLLARAALGLQAIGTRSWPSLVGDVIPALEQALDTVSAVDALLRARVLAALARELAWTSRDLARATRLAEEAVATARAAGDRPTLAECLLALHNVVWGPGNARGRLEIAEEVLELSRPAGRQEALIESQLLAASDLFELADPRAPLALAAYVEAAEATGQPRHRYGALCRRAFQATMAGRLEEADRLIEAATALGREIGEPDVEDVRLAQLWEVRSAQGRRGELEDELLALFRDQPVPGAYFEAMIHLEAGDVERAERAAWPVLAFDPAPGEQDRQWLAGMTFGAELVATLALDEVTRGESPLGEMALGALAPFAEGAGMIGAAIAFRGSVAHSMGLIARVLGRADEARGHFERALALHDGLGALLWSERTRAELIRLESVPATSTAPTVGTFARQGAYWSIAYAGSQVRLRDTKGLGDLAILLGAPGRPVHVADLAAAREGEVVRTGLGLGADDVLDEQARRAIRARLAELDGEIAEAESWSDPERAARARLERDALVEHLSAAAGLGGRTRRLGDQTERARKAVTARIRDAIRRIDAVHPALGSHLRASITTGTTCTYSPATPTSWRG